MKFGTVRKAVSCWPQFITWSILFQCTILGPRESETRDLSLYTQDTAGTAPKFESLIPMKLCNVKLSFSFSKCIFDKHMRRPVSSHFLLGIARMPLHWGAREDCKNPSGKSFSSFPAEPETAACRDRAMCRSPSWWSCPVMRWTCSQGQQLGDRCRWPSVITAPLETFVDDNGSYSSLSPSSSNLTLACQAAFTLQQRAYSPAEDSAKRLQGWVPQGQICEERWAHQGGAQGNTSTPRFPSSGFEPLRQSIDALVQSELIGSLWAAMKLVPMISSRRCLNGNFSSCASSAGPKTLKQL